jgi:hypothetical protein
MKRADETGRRAVLRVAGLFAAGAVHWSGALFQRASAADESATTARRTKGMGRTKGTE